MTCASIRTLACGAPRRFWLRGRIRCEQPLMRNSAPDDAAWLCQLVARSPVIPEARMRKHWQRVIPFLSAAQRYELAAALLDAEQLAAEA